MRTPQLWYVAGFMGAAFAALAEASPSHFFNAHLLERGRYQLNAGSQIKAGVNDELELSSLGVGYLIQPTLWNLGLKHQMFKTAHTKTSFNSQSFLFKSSSDLWLASLHGIITSWTLSPEQEISFGLMDGLVMTFAPETQSSLHLVTPVVAWDYAFTSHWWLTFVFARPVYAIGQLDSEDRGAGSLEIDFTSKSYNPGLGILTSSYTWRQLTFEAGLLYLKVEQSQLYPYFNLLWRLDG